MYCVFLCSSYNQVSSRRPVPLSNRLKVMSRPKLPHAMKAWSSIHACAAVSFGSGEKAALRAGARTVVPLSSLRRASARLKMLERRTTARFLHVSPRSAVVQPQQLSFEPKPTISPSRVYRNWKEIGPRNDRQAAYSETATRMTHIPHSERQKAFYSKYIRAADQAKVRQSARLIDAYRSRYLDKEDADDISRTFIRHRFSQRRSEDDDKNFQSAGKPEKTAWHSAVLQQSDDGSVGRFVIRRSLPQSAPAIYESDRRSSRSADVSGLIYSSPVAMQAAQSAALPGNGAASSDYRPLKMECVLPTAEKPGISDEQLLYRALSRSTVGSDWLAPVS